MLKFHDSFYGREEDMEKILQLLQSDSGPEHNVSIIPIVGVGGAGKTTLAHLVYDNPMILDTFELRSWVCLSRIDNVKNLLRAIIKSLTATPCDLSEFSELRQIVKEEVMSRKFLLVLDNLLPDYGSQIFGSYLLNPLRFGANGSKILVTTRKEFVVDTNQWMTKSFQISGLSEKDCWLILQECAFHDKDQNAYPDLIKFGKSMVPRCKGLPLNARAFGGLLRSISTDQLGSGVRDYDFGEPKKNAIFSVLKLSFGFLPEFLQKCLFYCSLFPKCHIFEKNYLIRLWMAQGYIKPQDGREEEDIGCEYLDELVARSFFQLSPIYSIKKQCYKMHDFVYEAVRVSVISTFQVKDFDKIHNVSSVPERSAHAVNFEALRECRDLHSMLLTDRHQMDCGRKRIQILSPKILSDLLENLLQLRALDLSFSDLKELLDSIWRLKNLRYLGLNYTNVRRLPSSLCSLYNLQTLELQDCAYLQNLPKELRKLFNLRHLNTRRVSGYVAIPHGIGQLTDLQTLSAFSVVEEDEWNSGIGELNSLANLRGDLCNGGLKNVISGKETAQANLNNKEGLESLIFQWPISGREAESDEMDANASEVFWNLKPHKNLGWCKKFPPLGRIPSLKHLFIIRMDSVQSVGKEFLGFGQVGMQAFPSLETLKIWDMYNWEEWFEVEGEDFPLLRSLSISRCFKLSNLPCFGELVELSIHGGAIVPSFGHLPSLTSLSVEGFHNIAAFMLPDGLLSINKLELKNCSQLSSLLGFRYSRSMREIKLDKCPVLDLDLSELPRTLEVVDIHQSCSLLSTWCPPDFHEKANACQVK